MRNPSLLRSILVATGLVAASMLVIVSLEAALDTTAPLIALLAVVASAWYGGLPGGLFAVVLASVLTPLALPPFGTYTFADYRDGVRSALLAGLGLGTAWLVAGYRSAAATLATTLASIGDGVLVVDRKGYVTAMNRVAEALTGWTSPEARGNPVDAVFRIVNEASREPALNPLHRVLRDGVIVGLANHTVLVARDGREIPIDDSGAPLRDDAGRIVGAVLIFRDDSARRQAERDLRASNRRLERITATAPDFVFIHDVVHGRNVYGNRDFPLAGYTLADVDQAPGSLTALVHRDDHEAIAAALARFDTAPDDAVLEYEHRVSHKNGGWRWLRVRASVYERAPDGRVTQIIGHAWDVTDHKAQQAEGDRLVGQLEQAVEAARAANRGKDRLLATVAHELRQPLTALSTAVAVLESRSGLDGGGRALAVLRRQFAVLTRIVDDLFDVSRVQQRKVDLRLETLDVRTAVEEAVSAKLSDLSARGLVLDTSYPSWPIWISADRTRLQQILSNLLANAVRYSNDRGRVWVRVDVADGAACVAVRDEGRGIAREFLPQLFEAFARGEQGDQGLGVGLSVVRGLVELHGGAVTAHSEGPGRGAEFSFTLPLAAGPAEEGAFAQDLRDALNVIRARVNDTTAGDTADLTDAIGRATTPMILADDDGAVVTLNGAACELLRYSREDTRPLRVPDLMAVSPTRTGSQWTEFISEGRQEGIVLLRRADGREVAARYSAVANIVPGLHLSAISGLLDESAPAASREVTGS